MLIGKFFKAIAVSLCGLVTLSASAAIPQMIAVERTQLQAQTVSTHPAAVSAKFHCSVKPAETHQNHQTTTVSITQISGTMLAENAKVNVYLGDEKHVLLTHACGYDFKHKKAVISPVIVSPPITDAQYQWICHAKLVSQKCMPLT